MDLRATRLLRFGQAHFAKSSQGGAIEPPFVCLDAPLHASGYVAMSGKIVAATVTAPEIAAAAGRHICEPAQILPGGPV